MPDDLAIDPLENESQMMRFCVDRASDAIFWIDRDGRIQYVNEIACSERGYSRDELLTMRVFDLDVEPDYQPGEWEKHFSDLKSRGAITLETRHRTKDGHIFPVEVTANYVHFGDREFNFAHVRNITARKRTELELAASEERLRASHRQLTSIFETVGDVIFMVDVIKDREFRFGSVNPAFTTLTGIPMNSVIGRRVEEILPEPSGATFLRNCHRAIDAKQTIRWEETSKYPTGIRIGDVSIAPLFSDDGICTHLVGAMHDVTERKAIENALRDSEERYRLAILATNDAVWDADLHTGRVVWNDVYSAAFERPIESADSWQWWVERVHVDDRERTRQSLRAAIDGGDQYWACDYRFLRADGAWAEIQDRAYISRDETGRPRRVAGAMRDVTDLKEAERWLRVTQFSMDHAVDSMFWINSSGEILYVNIAAAKTLGYARDELIGKRMFEIDPNVTTETWHEHWDEIKRRGSFTFQSSQKTRDGRTLATEVTVNFLCHDGREFNCAVVRDITERRRTENELLTNRLRLEAALDIANLADWEFDLISLSFTLDDRFYALCGTNATREGGYEMSAEKYVRDFCHPEDRHLVEGEIAKALATPIFERVLNLEYRLIRRSDGDVRHIFVAYHLRGDETGKAIRAFGIHQDITEVLRTQAKLHESHERFRVAIESLQEGFTLQNADCQIVVCNPSAERILGLTADEITGRTSLDPRWRCVHEDGSDFPGETHPSLVSLRDGIPQTGVIMGVYRPSGELVWISVNSVPVGPRSKPTAVLVTFTDITYRKMAEAELLASRRRLELLSRQLLRTREAELQHISRELHDEFGQMLTAMKMNLRSMQRSVDAIMCTRLDETIGMVDQAISQVRDLAVNLRPPQLNDLGLVAALHGYLRQQARIAGFLGSLEVEPVGLQVPMDLGIVCFRITQEAITNAVRHAGMQRIEISLKHDHLGLHLKICDDGRGFLVDDVLRRCASGGSLGLIGMQERASLAGGELKIESKPNQGTTISGLFPIS